MGDDRRRNGAAAKLTPEQQADLFVAVPSPDGGLWSGPKVVAFVRDRWGIEVVLSTGWQWLRNLGFRLLVPRSRHPKAASPELQPAERLWPLLREAVANRVFDDWATLTDTVTRRAGWIADHPEVVGPRVGFHWVVAA